jgi:hypothetical protein
MGKRGPRPKGEHATKSRVLSTRIRADLRQALELAARKGRRSLSDEIAMRLRRSFDEDERIVEALGGPKNYAVLRMISCAMELQGGRQEWIDDAENFDHVVHTINLILKLLRPAGSEEALELDHFMGELNARSLADELRSADASMPIRAKFNPMDRIKADLGEASARIEAYADGYIDPPDHDEQTTRKFARRRRPRNG